MRRLRFAVLPLPRLYAWSLGGALVALAVWWGLSGPAILTESEPDAPARAAIGQPAPEFTLFGLDGSAIRLGDFRGQPVVLLFWADWCTSCAHALNHLIRAAHDLGVHDLHVLAINIMQSPQVVQEFAALHDIKATILLDSNAEVSSLFSVSATPTYYFIDQASVVVGRVVGSGRERAVEGLLVRLAHSASPGDNSEAN